MDRGRRPLSFLREDCALARSRFLSLRCKVWVEVELCDDEEEEVEGFFFLLGISSGMLAGSNANCAGVY